MVTDDAGTGGTGVSGEPERRFADALVKAREDWAAADAATCAARADCEWAGDAVRVPLFGRPHLVAHPGGEVVATPREPVHVAVAILLLHYLLAADGTPAVGSWSAYRELPDGLFYAASFARTAEDPLARAFAVSPEGLDEFRVAARVAGGDALTLGDAAFRFTALPRVDVAVLLWAGDEEEPGAARVLFDAGARHYLPAEDLAGLGAQLAHRLAAAAR
jgi:hypothetical protein